MRVKICGITNVDDALFVEQVGAHALGVVLYSDSPRCVSMEKAEEILEAVGPYICTVCVTTTQSKEKIKDILELKPTAVQIYADFENSLFGGTMVIRGVHIGEPMPSMKCDAVLLDSSMGSGELFDIDAAREIVERSKLPIILSGGLTPENVKNATEIVKPYAVDISSGVELTPGVKDRDKVRAFIQNARSLDG